MDFFNFDVVFFDKDYLLILLAKILVAIAIFICLRFFSGAVSNVNSTLQLAVKDNSAFGISMAGVIIGVTIMLSGTVYDSADLSFVQTLIYTGVYGLFGVVLMSLSRWIFDKVFMSKINLEKEIIKSNVAAGIVDAGNVIAVAIIIRSVMLWSTGYAGNAVVLDDGATVEDPSVMFNLASTLVAVVICYFIAHVILITMSVLKNYLSYSKNSENNMQKEVAAGNIALALRSAGHRIGLALAISASSATLLRQAENIWEVILGWTVVSIIMIIALNILSFIANLIITIKINNDDEILKQRNVALGAVEGTIDVAIGFLITQLL